MSWRWTCSRANYLQVSLTNRVGSCIISKFVPHFTSKLKSSPPLAQSKKAINSFPKSFTRDFCLIFLHNSLEIAANKKNTKRDYKSSTGNCKIGKKLVKHLRKMLSLNGNHNNFYLSLARRLNCNFTVDIGAHFYKQQNIVLHFVVEHAQLNEF